MVRIRGAAGACAGRCTGGGLYHDMYRVSGSFESPRVAEAAWDEMRCENKSMRQRLNLRLKALEKRLPDETKPHKALLPEWLTEDLRQQGIRFDASGLPEKSSLQEKASDQIAPETPAPSPSSFYG